MRIFKFLLITFTFVVAAQAQRSTTQNAAEEKARKAYEAALRDANQAITRNTTVRDTAKEKFEDLQTKVNEAAARLATAQAKIDKDNGAWGGLQRLWKDPDPQALVDRNKVQGEIDTLNRQLESAQTELNTANTNLQTATTGLQQTKTTVETAAQSSNDQFASITTQINSMGLQSSINQLQLKGEKMKHAVEIMGIKYDNTLQGYYIRAQIAQTMQSPVFCKAAAQCAPPNGGSGNTPKLDENDFDNLIKRAPFKNAGPAATGTGRQ